MWLWGQVIGANNTIFGQSYFPISLRHSSNEWRYVFTIIIILIIITIMFIVVIISNVFIIIIIIILLLIILIS